MRGSRLLDDLTEPSVWEPGLTNAGLARDDGDLNPRPTHFTSVALPAELRRRVVSPGLGSARSPTISSVKPHGEGQVRPEKASRLTPDPIARHLITDQVGDYQLPKQPLCP
jgi:hypothetical protein